MRKLYCRNCGYDLSPMFARGEESGTCPECGSLALLERLKLRTWRNRVWRRSLGVGFILTLVGTIGGMCIAGVWEQARWLIALWPFMAPVATLGAVVYASICFRDHVRVRAAGGEFWALLFSVGTLSGIINIVLQGAITAAAMVVLLLYAR